MEMTVVTALGKSFVAASEVWAPPKKSTALLCPGCLQHFTHPGSLANHVNAPSNAKCKRALDKHPLPTAARTTASTSNAQQGRPANSFFAPYTARTPPTSTSTCTGSNVRPRPERDDVESDGDDSDVDDGDGDDGDGDGDGDRDDDVDAGLEAAATAEQSPLFERSSTGVGAGSSAGQARHAKKPRLKRVEGIRSSYNLHHRMRAYKQYDQFVRAGVPGAQDRVWRILHIPQSTFSKWLKHRRKSDEQLWLLKRLDALRGGKTLEVIRSERRAVQRYGQFRVQELALKVELVAVRALGARVRATWLRVRMRQLVLAAKPESLFRIGNLALQILPP